MPKATVVIDMPANCKEYRFFNEVWEEDALGYAKDYVCAFGCSHTGCYVERPTDCPFQPIPENYDDLYDMWTSHERGYAK